MTGWKRKWRPAVDKALNYLALARKAGSIELGEEPVGACARARKARLVVVASDATDHTWRRAKSFVEGTEQVCIRLPYDKDRLGQAVGRTALALAAITDPALALAFLKALPDPETYAVALEALEQKTLRLQKRQAEARAHEKNKQKGRTGKGKNH